MSLDTVDFDPRQQEITILAADGITPVPVPVPFIDFVYSQSFASEINYGSQIGALLTMLLVVLSMTPRNRFRRLPTIINIAGLVTNLIRCVLLSFYFTSPWLEFYTIMSGDVTYVPSNDYNISIVATALAIPSLVLIEAALIIQAWTMMKLWPAWYKWPSIFFSTLLVASSMGLKFTDSIFQCHFIIYGGGLSPWLRIADLALSTATISWFCFLFIIRLILHMHTHRTILPSAKGLSAMEVLVMTNGVLMLVPVIFAGLEWGSFTNFESGSLTTTSVSLVLPLGTLVAQRIANPSAFGSDRDSTGHGASHNSSMASANNKQPLMKTWQSDASPTSHFSGVTTYVASEAHTDKDRTPEKTAHHEEEVDLERGVRVDRQVEHREVRIL